MSRNLTTKNRKFRKQSWYSVIAMLGGFFGLYMRVGAWIMKRYTGFNLNNSMSNKLYSYKE